MLRAFVLADGEYFGDGTRYVLLDKNGKVFLEKWDGGTLDLDSVGQNWIDGYVMRGWWQEIDLDDAESCLYYADGYIRKLLEEKAQTNAWTRKEQNDRQLDGAGIRVFSIDEVASGAALEEVFGSLED